MRGPILSVVATLVIASIIGSPAMAKDGRKKVVESPYLTPVLGASNGGTTTAYYYDCLEQIGCAILPLEKGDNYAHVEIVDQSGGPVFGSAYAMPGGDHLGDFCGSTKHPYLVRGSAEILVHVISGVCPDGTPSIASTGLARATLFRRH